MGHSFNGDGDSELTFSTAHDIHKDGNGTLRLYAENVGQDELHFASINGSGDVYLNGFGKVVIDNKDGQGSVYFCNGRPPLIRNRNGAGSVQRKEW